MSSTTDYLSTAGALTDLQGIIERIWRVLKKYRKKKEVRERIDHAIPALSRYMKAMHDLAAMGRVAQIVVEESPHALSPHYANLLASSVADICNQASEMIDSFYEVAREANFLASFQGFMDDVKSADRGAFDAIMCFSRSFKGDTIDPLEFPTLLALYGPKPRLKKKLAEGMTKQVLPTVSKAMEMSKHWPRRGIKRETTSTVLQAVRRFGRASKKIRLDRRASAELLDHTPDWMQPIVLLVKETVKQ